uniref:Rhoptry kinase family protein ROP34, putative n=1 Tax=Neospora caninum (strain Liverpool) TaxID=572307 RepID=A0A0F7U6X9_NEOCL|nr:TPA: Rhoptry kinase family protein ROP34, putative [Neospora caninum Liverpool]
MCAFLSILAVLSVAGLRPRANFSLAANAEPPSAEERFPSTFHDSASADHQGAAEELQSTSERLAPDVHPLTGTQHRRLDSLVPGFLKRMQIFKRLRPVDDSKFNEFKKAGSRVTATFFSASHSEVTLIYKPSSALLDFLGFAREDVPYGLVIKAIPYEAVDLYSVVSEPYIHRMFDDKNKFPYVLPLLAALRSTTRRVVYLVLPLYRMLPNTVEEQAATVDFVLLLAELAMAARQLHERNLTHRDLKDDNFLVAPDGHIVVADMATVEFADEKSYLVGTTDFMPPETTSTYFLRHGFTRTRYDDTTDVYSLGVTFRRLGLMLMDQKVRIPNRKRLTTLVKKMTNLDPKARPNISQVMDDPYFEGIDFAVVRQRTGPAPFSKLPGADEAMKRIRAKIRQRQEEEDKFVNGEEGGRGKGKEKNAAKRKGERD